MANKNGNKMEKKILNINNIINERGISIASISRKSGLPYATLRDKLIRKTDFKTFEAMRVYRTFFQEYDYGWLFNEVE